MGACLAEHAYSLEVALLREVNKCERGMNFAEGGFLGNLTGAGVLGGRRSGSSAGVQERSGERA